MRRKGPWSTEQVDSTSQLAAFLLARAEHEVAVAIEPQTLVSWDHQERMGDAA